LLSAYEITGDSLFTKAYYDLVQNYDYNINVINQKITQPSDDNFSDDELAFLPYFVYIFSGRPEMNREFTLSIDRAWNIARSEKAPLWNFIYGAAGRDDFALEDAIWTLQNYPLSHVDWPVRNSIRKDIFLNPDLSREGNLQSLRVLPYDEISFFRYNSDPFEIDGGSGYTETDPSAWLVSYWIARYLGFII